MSNNVAPNTVGFTKEESKAQFYLKQKGELLEQKVQDLGEGIKGNISPEMTTADLTALENGVYRAQAAGEYNFPNDVEIPISGVADNTVPEGYSMTFSKSNNGWKLFQAVKMPEIEPNGIVEEGNENVVSGGEVYNFIDSNLKIKESFEANNVGYILRDNGNIIHNVNFAHSDFIAMKKGEVLKYGANVVLNPGSVASVVYKYNTSQVGIGSILDVKDVEETSFVEGVFIADVDCLVRLCTNVSNVIKEPYAILLDTRFMEMEYFDEELSSQIFGNKEIIPISTVGGYTTNGSISPGSTMRMTDYIELKFGERVDFGVMTTTNAATNYAILNVYDSDLNYVKTVYALKDYLEMFFEGSYVAAEDCFVGISGSTNNFEEGKSNYVVKHTNYPLKINDVGLIEKRIRESGLADYETQASNSITYMDSDKKIIISGTSFSYAANGWFELMCSILGVTGVNKSYSGERINCFSARILDGSFFTQDVLNECEVLMIMHTHNKDVYTLSDIEINGVVYSGEELRGFNAEDYENTGWSRLSDSSTGWNGPDAEFAAVFDYVLKKTQDIYYNERLNPESIYFGTKWGKPFNVVIATNWHDGRHIVCDSIRKLAKKWGLVVCDFASNIGFSRRQLHDSGVQHSLLYCSDTETIDGELFGWHFERGQSKPLVRRMAAIASSCIKVL